MFDYLILIRGSTTPRRKSERGVGLEIILCMKFVSEDHITLF